MYKMIMAASHTAVLLGCHVVDLNTALMDGGSAK